MTKTETKTKTIAICRTAAISFTVHRVNFMYCVTDGDRGAAVAAQNPINFHESFT